MCEVEKYLKLEIIGFIIANVVSFVNVLFVVLEKTFYIYAMTILKTVFAMIGDFFLIPQFGVNGIAYSNIVINSVCVLVFLAVIVKEKIMTISLRFSKSFAKDYLFIGLFGGSQIFLDNIIYSTIVCRLVNEVAEQGNYWIANNIIWGLMLIPISALSEIIKKDCKNQITSTNIKYYNRIIIVTFLVWLCFIPLLEPFLKNIMGIEDFRTIKHILVVLMPFYLAYSYTVLFDSILIGYGKTHYCFMISAAVNLVYYPVICGLRLNGVFMPNMTFICMMFGFGMVVHLVCSIICFMIYENKKRKAVKIKPGGSCDGASG